MTTHRSFHGRDLVGPEGSVEDVTEVTDRDLILRAVHEVLVVQFQLGKLAAEVGELARKQSRDAEEITIVRELRKDVKTWKRRAISFAGAVAVIVVAGLTLGYLASRFGFKVGSP